VKFIIAERIALLEILPHSGGLDSLKAVRTLREDLSIDVEDRTVRGFTQTDTQYTWDTDKDGEGKDIELDEIKIEVITKALNALLETESLPDRCLTVYEKVVENKEN